MNTPINPFLDDERRHALYGDPHRLTQRTSVLSAAKISGAPVTEVIADLGPAQPGHVLDVACGLDPNAIRRPSLYETFHSDNAAAVTAQNLQMDPVTHHQHRFRFTDTVHACQIPRH